MDRILLIIFLALTAQNVHGGDFRYAVRHPGLANALGGGEGSDWTFCGDGSILLESKTFPNRFFIGANKVGAVIKGISGPRIWEWSQTLSAVEFKQRLEEMGRASELKLISQDSLSVETRKFIETRLAIPQTLSECQADGPKAFSCGGKLQDPSMRNECCREGINKTIGIVFVYENPANPRMPFQFSYRPGSGNSVLLQRGKSPEPLRFCVTNGITTIKR